MQVTKLHFSEKRYKLTAAMSILGIVTAIPAIIAIALTANAMSFQMENTALGLVVTLLALIMLAAWYIVPFALFVKEYYAIKPTRTRIKATIAAAQKATSTKLADKMGTLINSQELTMYAKSGFIFTLQRLGDEVFMIRIPMRDGSRTLELRADSIVDVSENPTGISPSLIDMMTTCMNAYGQDVPIDTAALLLSDDERSAAMSIKRVPTGQVGD